MTHHKHDCAHCLPLGPYDHDRTSYDLYACPQQAVGGPTVVARYGDEPQEYMSGIPSGLRPLQEAYRRAITAGMLS